MVLKLLRNSRGLDVRFLYSVFKKTGNKRYCVQGITVFLSVSASKYNDGNYGSQCVMFQLHILSLFRELSNNVRHCGNFFYFWDCHLATYCQAQLFAYTSLFPILFVDDTNVIISSTNCDGFCTLPHLVLSHMVLNLNL